MMGTLAIMAMFVLLGAFIEYGGLEDDEKEPIKRNDKI